jgi:hypothetical protein
MQGLILKIEKYQEGAKYGLSKIEQKIFLIYFMKNKN